LTYDISVPDRSGVIRALQQCLLSWYAANARDLPWRRTKDPYHRLIAEVMLQQTGTGRVQPVYQAFLEQFPTLKSLAQAPTAEVIKAWSGMGYNRRAVNLQKAAQAIVERHGGRVPDDLEELLALPGIGPYSAAAIACFAFDKPVAMVDTNVRRVLGRILIGPDPIGPKEAWRLAEEALQRERPSAWHQALMDLGATICVSGKPRCAQCPVQDLCASVPAFTLGPLWTGRDLKAAERRPSQKQKGYYGTTRYYRGRIVEALRQAEGLLTVSALGPRVREDYTPADHEAWLRDLIIELEKDGLVRRVEGDGVALP
jgi:A/G-specific adenine glycosylase